MSRPSEDRRARWYSKGNAVNIKSSRHKKVLKAMYDKEGKKRGFYFGHKASLEGVLKKG
ncbi:hypothetical protein LS482_19890 [Sinomicrobium kalidii]|uniref:hypothetical protein n=1 Tax=Sinomicrobium kalidii TaxID=2900738 RepID=UPI001E5E6AAB|nr:hypothetical protein [Sinomicrobium kalidii]UGU15929.1 hypothetical protein LS482_19890 [Sinomicrobium kalidii]